MVRYVLLILALSLVGCGKERVRTVTVKIPMYKCPVEVNQIDVPIRPHLLIENDSKDAGEVVKQYKITVKQLQQHVEELEKHITTYRAVCEDIQQ